MDKEKPKFEDQLSRLASSLVTPERFGRLALINNLEPELSEGTGQLSLVEPETPPDQAA
jgi:hypothetical protein